MSSLFPVSHHLFVAAAGGKRQLARSGSRPTPPVGLPPERPELVPLEVLGRARPANASPVPIWPAAARIMGS